MYFSTWWIVDETRKSCEGESRKYLEMLCMKLPEEHCIDGPMNNISRCEEDEFNCGNGQCIHGLGVCDRKYQCMNGADEHEW